MSVAIVRYRTKRDRADENRALVEKVFGELDATRPPGFRYASFRLADGVSFVHVATIDAGDGKNPSNGTAAFAEFLRGIGDRCDEPPVASGAALVGAYGFTPTGSERSDG